MRQTSQIILERNDPKWSGLTEAMLWCVVQLMLCVHKTIFFPLGTEETIFHAFCCRLDSWKQTLKKILFGVNDIYEWSTLVEWRGQKQDWAVGEAYMVSLSLEFLIIPTQDCIPPAGTQIPQCVPCCTRGRVVYFTTWTHCSVFLYARLFSKLMTLSTVSLLYTNMFSSKSTVVNPIW